MRSTSSTFFSQQAHRRPSRSRSALQVGSRATGRWAARIRRRTADRSFTKAQSPVAFSLRERRYGSINMDPLFVRPGHWEDSGTPDDPADDVWTTVSSQGPRSGVKLSTKRLTAGIVYPGHATTHSRLNTDEKVRAKSGCPVRERACTDSFFVLLTRVCKALEQMPWPKSNQPSSSACDRKARSPAAEPTVSTTLLAPVRKRVILPV